MIRLKVLVALLIVWMPLCAGAQDVVIAPSRNVELMSIVCNIADDYTAEEDGYSLNPDASWMKPYTMFGEKIARHRAVRLIKKMDKRGVWLDYDLLGLSFDEFDFSRPGGVLRSTDDLDRPIVKRFLRAMDDLAAEDYIRSYFYETYPDEFGRIAKKSETQIADLHETAKKISLFMNEWPAGGFRVVPTIYIEPLVAYGDMMTDTSGRDIAVAVYGLSLDPADTYTSFNMAGLAWDLLNPFVIRAMDSPGHEAETQVLQELFPMVEAAARATLFYDDWYMYFTETITRALEDAMNGSEDYREQYTVGEGNFMLIEPAVGILQREFCGSGMPFFDFYPTLVARLAEIMENDENR